MSERQEFSQMNEAFAEEGFDIDEYVALQQELNDLKKENGTLEEEKGISGNIVIPMTADCADYETYRSGKYVPGLMGTLFSFVDKIISSFAPLIAGVVFTMVGFADHNPVEGDPVTMELRIGVAFLAVGLIICGLICNLIAMKFYPLTKEKMAEIQDKVAAIKAAAAAEEA